MHRIAVASVQTGVRANEALEPFTRSVSFGRSHRSIVAIPSSRRRSFSGQAGLRPGGPQIGCRLCNARPVSCSPGRTSVSALCKSRGRDTGLTTLTGPQDLSTAPPRARSTRSSRPILHKRGPNMSSSPNGSVSATRDPLTGAQRRTARTRSRLLRHHVTRSNDRVEVGMTRTLVGRRRIIVGVLAIGSARVPSPGGWYGPSGGKSARVPSPGRLCPPSKGQIGPGPQTRHSRTPPLLDRAIPSNRRSSTPDLRAVRIGARRSGVPAGGDTGRAAAACGPPRRRRCYRPDEARDGVPTGPAKPCPSTSKAGLAERNSWTRPAARNRAPCIRARRGTGRAPEQVSELDVDLEAAVPRMSDSYADGAAR
jgi:hypothetical protein